MHDSPLARLDEVASLVAERATISKDSNRGYVGLEHLPSGASKLLGFAEAGQSISTNNVFREGDVLFGKLRPRLRKSVRAPFDGYCSTDILVLRPTANVEPLFAALIFQSDSVFGEAIRTEEGTKMPRCSWSTLRKFRVYCPATPAQQRTAEILATVDEAIEQSEALIAKTQQIKAGLMHDLFTRGVTPDGQLRPPREEAPQFYKESPLGWIPKDWGVEVLDSIRDPRRTITYGVLKPGPYIENGIPLLQIEDVIHSELDFAKVHRISPKLDAEYSRTRVMGGEIVISLVGTIGRVAHLPRPMEPSNLHRNLGLIAIADETVPRFFFYYLQSSACMRLLARTTLGSTQSLLNLGSLRTLATPVPVSAERLRIADALDAVNYALAIKASELRKLQGVKAALMHDLLTGRVPVVVPTEIDVREVAVSV